MIGRVLVLGVVSSLGLAVGTAWADHCEARVSGVLPITEYDLATGRGFLALRAGPGAVFTKLGEAYLGDRAVVLQQHRGWYLLHFVEGLCLNPGVDAGARDGWAWGGLLDLPQGCDPDTM